LPRDGPRLEAVLQVLWRIALAPDGILYFGDAAGVRVVEHGQVRTVVTMASSGYPKALAVAPDGRVFFAHGRGIKEVKGNQAMLVAGSDTDGGYHLDGPALTARFDSIEDIAFDGQGRLLIADRRWIRALDQGQVSTLAGSGAKTYPPQDGPALEASLVWPRAVLESKAGIYMGDATYLRLLRAGQVSTLAGAPASSQGAVDGPLDQARFTRIEALAWRQDVLFLVDGDKTERVRYVESGVVHSLTAAKLGFKDGPISQALFESPRDLVVDAKGDLLVSDLGNCRIRHIQLEP
jgi:hypothetical protein